MAETPDPRDALSPRAKGLLVYQLIAGERASYVSRRSGVPEELLLEWFFDHEMSREKPWLPETQFQVVTSIYFRENRKLHEESVRKMKKKGDKVKRRLFSDDS